MNTSRDPHDPNCTADLGAQYITATPNYAEKHQSFYEELVSRGILKPFLGSVEGMTIKDEGICNYVAPQGISSIVKYYLSDSDVLYSRRVTRINLKEGKLEVCSDSGPAEMFDAVVLTMPVPQILKLQGDMKSPVTTRVARWRSSRVTLQRQRPGFDPDYGCSSERILYVLPVTCVGILRVLRFPPALQKRTVLSESQRQRLEAVRFSSRFALALFYEAGTRIEVPWAAKYIVDNPCVRFISIDSKKRSSESPEVGPSLVVHTTVQFGAENVDKDKDDVEPLILDQLQKVLPGLPTPTSVKCHKWRFSQVIEAVPNDPGQMTLSFQPLLVIGGDSLTHSNFDGCVDSALAVLNVFQRHL
ncbi:renalase isoform X2 [Rhinoraja longicauda]